MKRDIEDRALEFARRVLKMNEELLRRGSANRNSINQLCDAAGSIGANLEEARGAHSRADFHNKIRIALKEARESHYWLRLISTSSKVPAQRFAALIDEANQIVAILTTIAKKTNPRNPASS